MQLVLAELRELRQEVSALRAAVMIRPVLMRDDPAASGALVRCIFEQVQGRVWCVAELLEFAEVVPKLRAAIISAIGSVNGKKLGKLLGRIEGADFDGAVIVRHGDGREGILWVCKPAKAVVAD